MNKILENPIKMTLSDWASLCGIIVFFISIISIAFSAYKYIAIRSREQRQKNFENYHNILKYVSAGNKEKDDSMKLVSQLAYLYELRNFPEYKDITIRALISLITDWDKKEPDKNIKDQLIKESSLTLIALGYDKSKLDKLSQ